MTLTNTLLERLAASPLGLKLADEERQERLASRRHLVAELQVLDQVHAKAWPPLAAARDRAREVLKAAEKAVTQAQDGMRGAGMALASENATYDAARNSREHQLRKTAPPSIDAFLEELVDMRARVTGRDHPGSTGSLDSAEVLVGDSPTHHGHLVRLNNRDSVNACLAAIGTARTSAEALQLEALGDLELAERILAIRGSIPAIAAL